MPNIIAYRAMHSVARQKLCTSGDGLTAAVDQRACDLRSVRTGSCGCPCKDHSACFCATNRKMPVQCDQFLQSVNVYNAHGHLFYSTTAFLSIRLFVTLVYFVEMATDRPNIEFRSQHTIKHRSETPMSYTLKGCL